MDESENGEAGWEAILQDFHARLAKGLHSGSSAPLTTTATSGTRSHSMESLAPEIEKASISKDAPATPAPTKTSSSSSVEQKVTPWDVEGGYVDGKQISIDYDKLIKDFGTKRIDSALLERFERVTGCRPHPLLRRGSFFSHRCVREKIFRVNSTYASDKES